MIDHWSLIDHWSPYATNLNFELKNMVIFLHLQHVTIESFTPCLVDLCKALWEVMKSYYQTIQWHEVFDKLESTEGMFVLVGPLCP